MLTGEIVQCLGQSQQQISPHSESIWGSRTVYVGVSEPLTCFCFFFFFLKQFSTGDLSDFDTHNNSVDTFSVCLTLHVRFDD